MYKVLLLAFTNSDADTYPSMMLKIMKRVFGKNATTIEIQKPEADKKNPKYKALMESEIHSMGPQNFDFVIGVGDNHISKAGYDKSIFKGTPCIEFDQSDTKVATNVDYMFYHIPTGARNSKSFYVGSAILDDHLFIEPRETNKITIWVDHYSKRNDMTQIILSDLEKLYKEYPNKFRILHQNRNGIDQNCFVSGNSLNDAYYAKYDYDIICSLYRKADILFPTHRETQGMIAAEIGMCGGLTILKDYMYKSHITEKLPCIKYDHFEDLNWDHIISEMTEAKRKARREKVIEAYGVDAMRKRIFDHLKKIKRK